MDTDGPIFSSASASPPPISSAVLRCPLGTDRAVNKIPMQKPSCWMRFNGGLDADRAADPLDDAFRSFRLFPEHPRGRGRRRRRRGGRGEDGRRPRLTVLPLVPPVPLGQHAGQRRSKPVREGGGGDEQHGRAATARARLAHCRQSCLHCARDSLPHNHHHQREREGGGRATGTSRLVTLLLLHGPDRGAGNGLHGCWAGGGHSYGHHAGPARADGHLCPQVRLHTRVEESESALT